jgi:HlyD family secretion protein
MGLRPLRIEQRMSTWFAIALVVGIIAALIALARRTGREGIYVGIVENDLATDTDRDGLQVRAYVDEALVHELLAPSKLTGRMLIRETNASVPLTFVRVPPFVSPKIERSAEWQESTGVSVLPVVFRFDPAPDLAVQPGQLVDVYIGAAVDRGRGEKR